MILQQNHVWLTSNAIVTGLVISGSIWSKLVRSSKSSSSLDESDGVGVGSFSNLNEIWRASKLLCFLAWNDFLVWSNSSSEDDVPLSNFSSCFEDFTSNEACFFAWKLLRSWPRKWLRSYGIIERHDKTSNDIQTKAMGLLTLRIQLLCSDRDFVFWKCSRLLLKASSSNLSASSASSSPNVMCPPFRLDFFARFASSLMSSAKPEPPVLLGLSSDSTIGLKVVLGLFGFELAMFSAGRSATTVSRLVEVVDEDSVPSCPWLTLL